jgi:RecJ-like exonuclease
MGDVSTLLVTRVRLHAHRLDAEIADGADPMATGERAARAAQLLQPRMRHALAAGLRRAVLDARRTACVRSSAVHVARSAVCACASSLLELAAELGDAGVHPRGIALTRLLLSDGTGPLYCARTEEELRAAVDEIRAGL